MPYRGLTINGERRDWREVPHPEKLSLVQKILDEGSSDPARTISDVIGITRVTAQLRTEIAALIGHLGRN